MYRWIKTINEEIINSQHIVSIYFHNNYAVAKTITGNIYQLYQCDADSWERIKNRYFDILNGHQEPY